MAASGNEIYICPRNIRYTQDSIKDEFVDGRAMSETLEYLLYDRKRVEELPLIEVVRQDGKWWGLSGNRRLYLYRKLEELKVIHTIPVLKVSLDSEDVQRQLMQRMTTDCEGVVIRLRGNQPDWLINQVIDRWKYSKRNNRYVHDRNNANNSNRTNPSSAFTAQTSPSIRQDSSAQISTSVEHSSVHLVQPGSNRSAWQNYVEPRVITSQPRRSTDPVKNSNDSCCSGCGDSCCSCRCCCFPCCNHSLVKGLCKLLRTMKCS